MQTILFLTTKNILSRLENEKARREWALLSVLSPIWFYRCLCCWWYCCLSGGYVCNIPEHEPPISRRARKKECINCDGRGYVHAQAQHSSRPKWLQSPVLSAAAVTVTTQWQQWCHFKWHSEQYCVYSIQWRCWGWIIL